MTQHRSDQEKAMSAKRRAAEAEIREKHPDVIEIVASCWGSELYLECKLPEGVWVRYAFLEEEAA